MENATDTPEGKAFPLVVFGERKRQKNNNPEYRDMSVTVLTGDALRKEPLKNSMVNIILHECR